MPTLLQSFPSYTRCVSGPQRDACVVTETSLLTELTNGNGGDLCVHIQHSVAVHIHQVVPPALLIVAEEMNRSNILQAKREIGAL